MDDTAQKQNQVNDDAQVSVGTANKEIGVAPVSEFIKPSEKIVIDKEVTEAGIVEAEREIKIEEEHERMGVKPSAESTPVKTEPTGLVQLPMDEKEAEKQIKKGPGHNINLEKFFEGIFFADSVYGFAVLMAKHLKRIHHKITGQPI
jgi:hypothetical protein